MSASESIILITGFSEGKIQGVWDMPGGFGDRVERAAGNDAQYGCSMGAAQPEKGAELIPSVLRCERDADEGKAVCDRGVRDW